MCQDKKIGSIADFIKRVKIDSQNWGLHQSPRFPWYRGEPTTDTALVPRLFRGKYKDDYFENRLLQHFRMQAPSPEYGMVPSRDNTDQWLFLAQHVGLPTRLLDWTESPLVALYFALQEKEPVVWMLNPFELNRLSTPNDKSLEPYNIYALTWITLQDGINIGSESINAAWEGRESRLELPVAIRPTYIHTRMTVQKSCFTVHGNRKEGLHTLLSTIHLISGEHLKKYSIDVKYSEEMLNDLRQLGISEGTLFPSLDGLAKDLTRLFRPDCDESHQ